MSAAESEEAPVPAERPQLEEPREPRTWRPWRLALASVVLLLALRAAQLGCMAHQLYLGEFAQLGRMAWELQTGAFEWQGVAWFAHEYRWFQFAQGTLLIQVMTAALAPFLPGTLAMHGPSMLAEAATVWVFAVIAARRLPLRLAVACVAALILSPAAVVAWQLLPFGNHSEFLVVPPLLVLLVGGEAVRSRGWLLAAVALGGGLAFYQAHGLTLVAFAAACALEPGRRRGVLVAGLAVAVAWLGLRLMSSGADVQELARYLRDMQPMIAGPRVEALQRHAVFGAPQLQGWAWGLPYRLVLLVFAGAAWSTGRFEGRFPALLAVLGVLVPLVVAPGAERYFLLAFVGLMLAVPVALRANPRLAPLLAVLVLGGAWDNARFLQTDGVEAASQVDALAFGPGLGVWWLDADEVPYWRALADSDRASRWAGHATKGRAGAACASHAFGFRAVDGGVPAHDRERCFGFEPGELAWAVDSALGEGRGDGGEDEELLDGFGRGAWIVAQRDLAMLEAALQGADPALVQRVMAAARDEAKAQAR